LTNPASVIPEMLTALKF